MKGGDPGLALGGGRGSQCWLSTQTGLGGLLCTGTCPKQHRGWGDYGLPPPFLPLPLDLGFWGGSGLCWFCPPCPSRAHGLGGHWENWEGVTPSQPGGAQLRGAPPDPSNRGGVWQHHPWRGGGAQSHETPQKSSPQVWYHSWGGGKTPQKSPPCTPTVPDPPSQHRPRLGRGGCGWECGEGGSQCWGGQYLGSQYRGGPSAGLGGLPVLGGAINGSQHLGGGQSQCWKHSQFGGLGRTGKGGFPVLENGEGVPVLERGGGGGTSPQGGGWGSK